MMCDPRSAETEAVIQEAGRWTYRVRDEQRASTVNHNNKGFTKTLSHLHLLGESETQTPGGGFQRQKMQHFHI